MGESAFVISYFRTKKEALHLAISQDGYNWKSLNRNRPLLSSHLGTRTMRDPFLFRDRGGTFHLLATDGWTSPYIIHARTEDLITWKEMTSLQVRERERFQVVAPSRKRDFPHAAGFVSKRHRS